MINKKINSELQISSVVLGSCYFGTQISEQEAFAMLDKYYELGGRCVDTARVYASWLENGESASEKTIGKWLKSRNLRDEITLVTKGGHPPIHNMDSSRLDKESIYWDIEKSLDSLGTSCVDLYLLHRDDKNRPVEEIMDTLDSLVKKGYAKNIGVSNWCIDRINKANKYAEKSGKALVSVSQIQWSLARTTPEAEEDMTLVCMNKKEYKGYLQNKMPVMAFSSQGKGFFSKYLEGGKSALNTKIIKRFYTQDNLERAMRVKILSEKYNVSPAAIALSFISSNPLNGIAVVGCSNVSQIEDSMMQTDLKLTKEDIDFLTNKEGF